MFKILHLAHHIGNIGDDASHYGTRKLLASLIKDPFEIDELELRKTYRVYNLPDKWLFDSAFAELANKYDLLLIGGGSFLDFWVPDSVTATSLDISDTILNKIKTPMILCSMGCKHRNAVPEGNIEKLRVFLDRLLNKEKTYIAMRNDGSREVISKYIGEKYSAVTPEVLDSGFFYDNNGSSYRPTDKEYVLINLTSDQLLWANKRMRSIDLKTYKTEMVNFINYVLNETHLDIVFAPHIFSDLEAILNILSDTNNYHIQSRILVAPYAQGAKGTEQLFSAYKNSSLVVGMRFHANVCSIALDKPSLGLAAADRIISLYESLNLQDRVIRIDGLFSENLIEQFNRMLASQKILVEKASTNLSVEKNNTINIYKKFFNDFL